MRKGLLFGLVGAALLAMSGAAAAHSFNVLLLLPLTGPDADAGKQARRGFMLATRERDSHPGEESDGHLGGLDVYVSTADTGDPSAGRPQPADGEAFAVVVALDPTRDLSGDGSPAMANAAAVGPRRTPFEDPSGAGREAVASFADAYKSAYGAAPSDDAAQGYDAARRIDAAVREAGGTADRDALAQRLDAMREDFRW